MKTICICICIR